MKNNIVYTAERRSGALRLSLLIVAGIAAGTAFAAGKGNLSQAWAHQFFSPIFSGNTAAEVFRNTFLSSAAFITAAFFIGLSAAGQPFGAALALYRGFGIGASAAGMYLSEGASALPAVLVLLVPKALAVSAVSVLAVRELFRSSGTLLRFFLFGENGARRPSAKLYLIKYGVLMLLSLLISGADAAMNYFFAGLL
ncbi:MAG: hypothetical protein IJ071_11130 [Ruminococcus sp.]|nr:hypothetical protein [Ruminococcus sp.]